MNHKPFGALGDLTEDLVQIATSMAQVSHEEGPNAVLGVLLRVQALERELSDELRAQLAGTPGGVWGVAFLVAGAMVNPDAGVKELLGWAEPLASLEAVQREQRRLQEAGVRTAGVAETLAGPVAAAQQETTRDRMLRVVQGGRVSA